MHPSAFTWPLSSQWLLLLASHGRGWEGTLVTGGPQRPGKKESVVQHLFAVTLMREQPRCQSTRGRGRGGDSFSHLTWPLAKLTFVWQKGSSQPVSTQT